MTSYFLCLVPVVVDGQTKGVSNVAVAVAVDAVAVDAVVVVAVVFAVAVAAVVQKPVLRTFFRHILLRIFYILLILHLFLRRRRRPRRPTLDGTFVVILLP